ncbi:ABC-2 type transport system permease protein [Scopulibacillus darangshiensis]|uniref:ABC-2 type transport system permease protein n=1 Tax=Scopulibacillus darangshiensis TaxID=442528 RepID=A0A4R2P5M9_9BACL|nr:ABC transporter permease [Scopulibacillus darangshiensis]TCP29271.1 ABC-2 type transport system permease protein [Scopulibacillus darangshiensis]
MDKIIALWYRRRSDYWKMALRYWKLVGKNSGLMFSLYVIIIVGSYYYKQWLDGLPDNFPSALLITVVAGIFVIRTPIRTFVQEADLVFLLPLEPRLNGYFRKSRQYSFLLQCVTLLFVMVIFSPLYFRTINPDFWGFAATLILIFGVKWWNVDTSWQEQFLQRPWESKLIRGCLSLLFLYSLLNGNHFIFVLLLIAVMFGFSFFYAHRQAQDRLLNWDRLLAVEHKQLMLLLKFANLITDVPEMKTRIKPRLWLNGLTNRFSYGQESVFKKYFLKTFIRAHEYFGIYIRLTIIGGIIEVLFTDGYATYFVLIAIVYITGLQLLTLWHHPTPQALTDLYPVADVLKQRSFVMILLNLLMIQGVVLGLIGAFVIGTFTSVILLVITGLFIAFLFSYGYVRRKIKKSPA